MHRILSRVVRDADDKKARLRAGFFVARIRVRGWTHFGMILKKRRLIGHGGGLESRGSAQDDPQHRERDDVEQRSQEKAG
ncbi:hypothetical protein DV096_08730 [Bradymonadaceae bacterium TMQ3]|nr:hypothetical protein DV096_08730 [Bradymonadaceae bacterium TMQ3]